MHARGVGLKHRRRAIDIDHESGEEVAFAVDKAIGGIVGAHKTEGLAEAESFLKASAIEVGVDRLAFAECEHSHGYGADLKMPGAYDSAVGGFDAHEVAFFDTGILARHLDKTQGWKRSRDSSLPRRSFNIGSFMFSGPCLFQ